MRFSSGSVLPRLATVTCLFLVSACVINRASEANQGIVDDDEQHPAAEPKVAAKPETKVDGKRAAAAKTTAKRAVPSAPAAAGEHKAVAAPLAKGSEAVPVAKPAVVTPPKAPVTDTNTVQLVKASGPKPTAHSERVVRYVSAIMLNVRSLPRSDAPVVAKVTRGSMFYVGMQGDWAQVGDHQYVLAKYLSRAQPASRGTVITQK